MILTQDNNNAAFQIRSYKPGAIQVNDKTYHKSFIITPKKLIEDWPPQQLNALQTTHLDCLIALKPEVLLLGTGEQFHMPKTALLAPLYQAQIGVECMSTNAACHTYMVLSSEGRHVVAALLIE